MKIIFVHPKWNIFSDEEKIIISSLISIEKTIDIEEKEWFGDTIIDLFSIQNDGDAVVLYETSSPMLFARLRDYIPFWIWQNGDLVKFGG